VAGRIRELESLYLIEEDSFHPGLYRLIGAPA
jgi:hypothetical protein